MAYDAAAASDDDDDDDDDRGLVSMMLLFRLNWKIYKVFPTVPC